MKESAKMFDRATIFSNLTWGLRIYGKHKVFVERHTRTVLLSFISFMLSLNGVCFMFIQ